MKDFIELQNFCRSFELKDKTVYRFEHNHPSEYLLTLDHEEKELKIPWDMLRGSFMGYLITILSGEEIDSRGYEGNYYLLQRLNGNRELIFEDQYRMSVPLQKTWKWIRTVEDIYRDREIFLSGWTNL